MSNKTIPQSRLHEEDVNTRELLNAGFDHLMNLSAPPLQTNEWEMEWLNAELEKLNLADLPSE